MLRSMYAGISGMRNFQTKLDVIGNNIANVNTYGFKKGRTTFSDLISQQIAGASAPQANRGGQNPQQVGLGSTLASIDTIHTQGALQTTARPLDVGISGDGYFVVAQGNQQFYTRAGNFYLDLDGTLVNANGLKVQGFNNGVLGDIVVNTNAIIPPIPSTEVVFGENLSSNAIVDNTFSQEIYLVDNNGEEQTINITYTKTGQDAWTVTVGNEAGNESVDLTFANGEIAAVNGDGNESSFTINNPGWIDLDEIELNFVELMQNASATTAIANPDGNLEGELTSFDIGASGEVNGVYSNGHVQTIAQIAIAKFSNNEGLNKAGSNLYQTTVNSGAPNIGLPGDGRGELSGGSLEMSNVDLAEEFTEMIVAQRGFQANTRIITTSDEILQELVNLKR